MTYPDQALHQLAHEVIHLLAPNRSPPTVMLEEGLAAARAPALAAPCAMSRSVGRRSPRILNCAPMGSRNTVRFSIANGPAACITIHSCASLNAIGIVDLINESFAHSVTDLINFIGLGYELQGCRREALPKRATVEETNWEKWAGEPRPGDAAGAYSYEQLLRMDGDFTAALERAFAAGLESPLSARRIYAAKG